METKESQNEKLEQLWRQLLELRPTNNDLLAIILEIEPLRQKALEQLFKQGITRDEIACIMITVPELNETAQKLLAWRNRNMPVIKKILEQMKALAEETKKGQR